MFYVDFQCIFGHKNHSNYVNIWCERRSDAVMTNACTQWHKDSSLLWFIDAKVGLLYLCSSAPVLVYMPFKAQILTNWCKSFHLSESFLRIWSIRNYKPEPEEDFRGSSRGTWLASSSLSSWWGQIFVDVLTNDEANGAHWEEVWIYLRERHFTYVPDPAALARLAAGVCVSEIQTARTWSEQLWRRWANGDLLLLSSADSSCGLMTLILLRILFMRAPTACSEHTDQSCTPLGGAPKTEKDPLDCLWTLSSLDRLKFPSVIIFSRTVSLLQVLKEFCEVSLINPSWLRCFCFLAKKIIHVNIEKLCVWGRTLVWNFSSEEGISLSASPLKRTFEGGPELSLSRKTSDHPSEIHKFQQFFAVTCWREWNTSKLSKKIYFVFDLWSTMDLGMNLKGNQSGQLMANSILSADLKNTKRGRG